MECFVLDFLPATAEASPKFLPARGGRTPRTRPSRTGWPYMPFWNHPEAFDLMSMPASHYKPVFAHMVRKSPKDLMSFLAAVASLFTSSTSMSKAFTEVSDNAFAARLCQPVNFLCIATPCCCKDFGKDCQLELLMWASKSGTKL